MKISSYSIASSPALADKLIGTKVGGPVVDGTFNFTIQQLSNLILAPVNLQKVLDTGNTATQSINLNGNITVNGLTAVLGTMGTLQAGVINSSDSINSLGTLSLRATNALSFRTTGNLLRWSLDRVGTEFSGNQGSNLSLSRYNDAGSFLSNVFTIDRQSGNISVVGNITVGELTIGGDAGFGYGIVHGQGDEVIATWDLNGTGNFVYGNQQLVVTAAGNTLLGYGMGTTGPAAAAQLNILANSNDKKHIKLTEPVDGKSWGISCTSDDGDFVITDTEAANATRFHIQKGTGIVTVGSGPFFANTAKLQVGGDGYFSKNGGGNITINSEAFGNSKLTLLSNSSVKKNNPSIKSIPVNKCLGSKFNVVLTPPPLFTLMT